MNKIFDINLGGIPFQIDDNAYEVLTAYLTTLKNHFAHTIGYEEILNDIENRLAEMFSEKIKNGSRIISIADVEEATTSMGKPEQIDENVNTKQEQTQQKTKETHQQTNEYWYRRRLYRNADDKILGGVCSGLGATLGIDKVWIRLAFACSILLLGTGALLYIILWIIIPEAKSATEKLEMQGEPINIHSIGKQIEEDAKAFSEHMKKWGEEVKSTFKDYTKKKSNYLQKQKPKHKNIFYALLKKLVRFIAIIYKLIFLLILLALILIVLRGLGWKVICDYPYEFSKIFSTSTQSNIILISLLVTLSISMAMGIIGLLKYIFHFKSSHAALKYLRGSITSIAFISLVVIAIIIVNDFSHQGKVYTEIPITTVEKDKLYIELLHTVKGGETEGDIFITDRTIKLSIESSTDSAFHLEKYAYARSNRRSAAEALARKTIVPIVQHDSVIEIGNYYDWLPGNKWRNQFVELVLKIPKNKIAYIHQDILNYVNVHFNNVYIEDATAFTGLYAQWTTTDKGLICLNLDTSTNKIANASPFLIDLQRVNSVQAKGNFKLNILYGETPRVYISKYDEGSFKIYTKRNKLYIFQKNKYFRELNVNEKHLPTKITVILPALIDDDNIDDDIDFYIDPKLIDR